MRHEVVTSPLQLTRPVRVDIARSTLGVARPGHDHNPLPAPRVVVINASVTLGHPGVLDGATPATWEECPNTAAADSLWNDESKHLLVAMACDGRNWVVRRALGELPPGIAPRRLFEAGGLQRAINLWLDRSYATLRLAELDRLAGAARVRLLREEAVVEHDHDLWRHWLTEDDKALFRRSAGSMLEELGYLGKGGW